MTNKEISQQLSQIGIMLEILQDSSLGLAERVQDRFKITAYEKAARAIENYSISVEDIYQKKDIKGIGESIAEKIEEFIKTGKIAYYEELRKKIPKPIINFMKIPGVGSKIAKKLFKSYKVKTIKDLKKAIKLDKTTKYFQEKTKQNILRDISMYEKIGSRILLSFAEPIAKNIIEIIKKYPEVKTADYVGSLRRMKETVGDIDIIASLKLKTQNSKLKTIERFIREDFVDKVVNKGDTKATIITKENVQIDLEILPQEDYGSLLQHFTGSKDHNIALRTYAQENGFSISEHGIKKTKNLKLKTQNNNSKIKTIKCPKEEDVYKTLGMEYIEPELRENQGEIKASIEHQLPKLVKLHDIKGDLQMHSTYSDGSNTIEEMAKKCKSLGYEYLAITDHPSTLGVTNGLKEKDIDNYINEIRKVSKKIGIKIFAGIEANIKPNGDIDLPNEILKKFDIVLGAIHSSFRQDKHSATRRLIRAIQNPYIRIIAHPSARLINKRLPIELDWEEIFKECVKQGVAMEINSHPIRLDLRDVLIRKAINIGVKLIINTDSHQVLHLDNMRYGVAQARRGWAEKKDIINTKNLRQLSKWIFNR